MLTRFDRLTGGSIPPRLAIKNIRYLESRGGLVQLTNAALASRDYNLLGYFLILSLLDEDPRIDAHLR